MPATQDRITMADILRLEAATRYETGQLLDELVAEQIRNLADTAERYGCRTPLELRLALSQEAAGRLISPSAN